MIYQARHIEYLETLPLRQNRAAYIEDKVGGLWETAIYRNSWYTEKNPWRLSKFMLEKYLNKPFNDMYSEWSKRTKSKDLFREYKYIMKRDLFDRFYSVWGYLLDRPHYVDEDGIIRFKKKIYHKKKYNLTTNTQITVTLTPELRLKQALKKAGVENSAKVTKLTISGSLTDFDFEYIRLFMGKTLQILDLKNASTEGNRIKDWTFSKCSGFNSVIIPDSVTEIENMAFAGCTGLTSFVVEPDNPVFTSENGVLLNKSKTVLIAYPEGRQGKYVIPASVTEIENSPILILDNLKYVIWSDPERCSGILCFFGTRVFVSTLFDFVDSGDSKEYFHKCYSWVSLDKINKVLELRNVIEARYKNLLR